MSSGEYSRKKAIYILGCSLLGLRVLEWAKELKLKIILTDRNRQSPGFIYADEKLIADSRDIDKHVKFARKIKNTYEIVGVYCGNEEGLYTLNYLSKLLHLPFNSPQSINRSLNKGVAKRIWAKHKLPIPKGYVVKSVSELKKIVERGRRYVIKPTKGSGSRGTQVIDISNNLEKIFNDSRPGAANGSSDFIVEHFLEGRHVDANGFFLDGKFFRGGVLEKFILYPECLPIGGHDPVNLKNDDIDHIYTVLEKACRLIGLKFGPVKGDFILSKDGKLFLLEVAPRFHGDVTTCNTLPFGSRINPVKFYFKYLSSGSIDESLLKVVNPMYGAWRVICLPAGRIKDIKMKKQPKIKGLGGITKVWLKADKHMVKISPYSDTSQIPGYICAFGRNQTEVNVMIGKFFKNCEVHIESNKVEKKWYLRLGSKIDELGLDRKSFGYHLT